MLAKLCMSHSDEFLSNVKSDKSYNNNQIFWGVVKISGVKGAKVYRNFITIDELFRVKLLCY